MNEPRMAYIIIKGCGEYADRRTSPAKVYLDREQAQAAVAALEEISGRYHNRVRGQFGFIGPEAEKLAPQAKAEYAALGFDADIYDDWELAEADIVGANEQSQTQKQEG